MATHTIMHHLPHPVMFPVDFFSWMCAIREGEHGVNSDVLYRNAAHLGCTRVMKDLVKSTACTLLNIKCIMVNFLVSAIYLKLFL